MYKVFTVNKNGKIELSKEELQKLLDDSYWEGYRANSGTYVYHSPSWNPWTVTYCSNSVADSGSITCGKADGVTLTADAANIVGSNAISTDAITISLNNIEDAIKAGDLN